MSRLVARILLSMFMFPFGLLLWWLSVAVCETALRQQMPYRRREDYMFLAADAATWAGVAAYWCLLWRSSVRWTATRVRGTLLAVLGAAAIAVGIATVLAVGFGSWSELGTILGALGGPLAILFWLFATILLWRETVAERAARVTASGASAVTCPTCGYNLTGLIETRCPECGSRFTLDELLAAQPARAAAGELE